MIADGYRNKKEEKEKDLPENGGIQAIIEQCYLATQARNLSSISTKYPLL